MLSEETFKIIVASTPLVSIDFVVRDLQGKILLGKRVNRPAQGSWFVPGGRVLKGESVEQAYSRLLKIELGMDKTSSCFKGVYQHFYEDNFSEEPFTTHYIVLAYEVIFDGTTESLPVVQHNDYHWFSEDMLLDDDDVHLHTKWYFQKDKQADILITNL
ncbi:GDP-mannose mannosyl hydrolase [Glaciecola sp. MH2013]|nr:GDP-mannose mannosyl hydrolase [Glaciecola sp. MH2013]MBF7072219.1 GDP-mannose mannosyl hydrolase [Glaciecola sp. MH2013]